MRHPDTPFLRRRLTAVTSAVAIAAFLLIAATTSPQGLQDTDSDEQRFRGTVTGWSVLADGTVRLRMVVDEDQQPRTLWVKTPADMTDTTRFEHMVLHAALEAPRGDDVGPRFTVIVEEDEVADGESAEKALPLVSLSMLD